MKKSLLILTLLAVTLAVAKASNPLIESILLLHLGKQKGDSKVYQNTARRSYQEFDVSNNIDNQKAFENDSTFSDFPPSQLESFEATKTNRIITSNSLENSLITQFDQSTDIKKDLADAISYLVTNKSLLDLSDEILKSAIKSVYKTSVLSQSLELIDDNELSDRSSLVSSAPKILLDSILPKISELGGTEPNWIKYLAQATTEGLMEIGVTNETINLNANMFSQTVVDLSTSENFDAINPNRKIPNNKMQFGGLSGFDPSKFAAYQQLAVGLTQGYLNSRVSNESIFTGNVTQRENEILSVEDLRDFSDYDDSIIKSATDGLLSALSNINQKIPEITIADSSLYTYDSVKSLANGFVLSATVYATSEPDYLANGLYKDAAEVVSRGMAHSAVSHDIAKSEGISVGRIAESVSHGSAMGAQLATVLPKSMEYVKNWEIFSQSRRDIAQSVSRGSSFGAVDAASIYFSDFPDVVDNVSRGSSMGSMIGTTGLAIYYPTDQLVPIINFTAQGSAYGSVNSKNLRKLKQENTATEQVTSSLARQSAIGSSLGAIFEPSVLLGLSPDTKSNDRQTIDNLSAATFGATFGAVQGAQNEDITDIESGNPPNKNEKTLELVEISQAVKQGSIEGALAGAKLALGIESTSEENLNSKGSILKAINTSNAKAASDANTPSSVSIINPSGTQSVSNTPKTSSKDMLLLMKKFGINPRYTNAATMFKRPVVRPIDEPPEDLVSDSQPTADNNESYAEDISLASPI